MRSIQLAEQTIVSIQIYRIIIIIIVVVIMALTMALVNAIMNLRVP